MHIHGRTGIFSPRFHRVKYMPKKNHIIQRYSPRCAKLSNWKSIAYIVSRLTSEHKTYWSASRRHERCHQERKTSSTDHHDFTTATCPKFKTTYSMVNALSIVPTLSNRVFNIKLTELMLKPHQKPLR